MTLSDIQHRIEVLKSAGPLREILTPEIAKRFEAELWDKKAIIHLVEFLLTQGYSDEDVKTLLEGV